jgi:hypothetical protein
MVTTSEQAGHFADRPAYWSAVWIDRPQCGHEKRIMRYASNPLTGKPSTNTNPILPKPATGARKMSPAGGEILPNAPGRIGPAGAQMHLGASWSTARAIGRLAKIRGLADGLSSKKTST